MKNKLLLTTAIASGMMISTAAFSDVKISGDIEQIYRSISYSLAAQDKNGGAGLGAETNIAITYTGQLTNGLKVAAGSVLEDGTADTEFLTISGEMISVTFGQDAGNNLSSTVVPHVSDQDGTLFGTTATNNGGTAVSFLNQYGGVAHNTRHVSLDAKAAGGTFTARYSPSTDTNRTSDSGIDTTGKSATEILYAGSLGVAGLNVQVGQQIDYAKNSNVAGSDDAKLTKIGASYNFGQITVGADQQSYDDGSSSNSDTKSTRFAAVFAVNDQIKIGARYTKTDIDGTTADEKLKTIEIGYNLGGLGIELSYGQGENLGGSSTATDIDVVQLRTRQAF